MTIATLLFALIAMPTSPSGAGSSDPIMLDFTASWCGPCRQMRPVVEQLIDKGYPIKAIDVDQSPDLAEKYQVSGVPAFVVVDPATGRQLARIEGARPAATLANLYNETRAKYRNALPASDESVRDEDDRSENEAAPEKPTPLSANPNPKPWETVVRIKVHGAGTIGFGSGTIIHSTPEESLILTCAHIFEGGRKIAPSQFSKKITVDLFDGNLSGPKKNQVHYSNETFVGEAVDYDFGRDVGLIRISPGRRLPFAKVVPPHWKPKANMSGMITVGCSEGHDATAWYTSVVNPDMKGLNGNRAYEAIECVTAPKQGRSGGGLFTSDGYIAGVCDFAEPQGNHGLYAHPNSIYQILDRNKLMALYDPSQSRPKTLLAKNRPAPRRSAQPHVRTQSPDRDDPGAVTLPPPEMLGIRTPELAESVEKISPPTSNRNSWHPSPSAKAVEQKMDSSADPDRFGAGEPVNASEPESAHEPEPLKAPARLSNSKWKAGKTPLSALSVVGVN